MSWNNYRFEIYKFNGNNLEFVRQDALINYGFEKWGNLGTSVSFPDGIHIFTGALNNSSPYDEQLHFLFDGEQIKLLSSKCFPSLHNSLMAKLNDGVYVIGRGAEYNEPSPFFYKFGETISKLPYEQLTFNALTYLQCCAIIKYKGRNMRQVLGMGHVNGVEPLQTGSMNTRGLNWGEQTGKYGMKLFGLENMYGNLDKFVDGIVIDSSGQILTSDGNFNDDGDGYNPIGQPLGTNRILGFLKDIIGVTGGGFVSNGSVGGSDTTYFCDFTEIYPDMVATYGGNLSSGSLAGLTNLSLNHGKDDALRLGTARLTYFKPEEIIEIPTPETKKYTYTGLEQTFSFSSIDSSNVVVLNDHQTNAGTYAVKVELKSASYYWSDMTNGPKTFTWNIAKKTIHTPLVTDTEKTYTGNKIGPTIEQYDKSLITVNGNEAIDAGSYTITFALVDNINYVLSGQNDINWTINRANLDITVDKDDISLNTSKPSETVNVSNLQGRSLLQPISSDTSIVVASANGSTVNVSGVNNNNGSAKVTVTAEQSTNYNRSSVMINVLCNFIKIVPFSSGTDAEIVAMVTAADEGKINLSDYWSVGDERNVYLSAIPATGSSGGDTWNVGESQPAQTVTFVLMQEGLYSLVTPVKDKTGASRSVCSFITGLKNCMSVAGRMDSSSQLDPGWYSSERRIWCNEGFRFAVPQTLRPIFKKFKTQTAASWDATYFVISEDYFTLAASAEIFKGDSVYGQGGTAGKSTAYSNLAEFNALTRFKYYETKSNIQKRLGDDGALTDYYTRSQFYTGSNSICTVTLSGSANGSKQFNDHGISPIGCI